ncbi:MAG: hypothetical protein A3I68_06360 [Candidatus Melainabacteria bacterium RIFCSPLOWO2_02_FULL_35_15]|nr:MAG: hypothetical protein A3F80_08065 [Candidatus Melainabacteria bacterium RIFCSPLOWO2_12_FULL_35_11]OGI14587.1 MAG: hypothetical protein A3I68_06360 [Candidatus Melainabacteria bacterium RIFCSPLOWO2_02_FULL_35_15]
MAKLISEDEEIKSSLELLFLKDKIKNKIAISWIPYKIILTSGEKSLIYELELKNKGAGDYVLALKPVNEIENLTCGIKKFLRDKKSTMFSFEPNEPSFELILERSHRGYSATCWLDAGNVISNHYSWDGFGVRFFMSEKNIISFVEELSKEKEELFNVC